MPRSGTTRFTDAEDYQAGIGGAKVNLVFSCQRDFEARLTWVELSHLQLFRSQENLARVASVSLMPERVFVAIPTRDNPPPICDGVEVQPGNIVFHSLGERVHQRTRGPSQWGLISLAPEHLAACSKALTGIGLVSPPVARILQLPRIDAARLLRLHGEACRLAETKPEMITHREVARALEQDLLHTLVNCLTSSDAHYGSARKRHHANIVARFEDALSAYPERYPKMPELCTAIGVPERTLRICCAEVLGMGPSRYLRLRRMSMVRAALRRADPATASVSELARRHGFSEFGRFAVIYRRVFGEMPSTTLRRPQITRP
jgi:AraC-like DNA-binding protein